MDCNTHHDTGCYGGWIHYGLDYIIESGICNEIDYPYTAKEE